MPKSAVSGTSWYWREGMLMAPIGSGQHGVMNSELCLPVRGGTPVDAIRTELENHQIDVHTKIIHQGFNRFPSGTKILYAYCPTVDTEDYSDFQENIENLHQYLLENEATVYDQQGRKESKMEPPAPFEWKSLLKFFARGPKR